MKRKKITLFFIIIFITAALFFKITNNDIFFHIKAGEWIVSHQKNIGNNVFSYAAGNEKLFNHEVLSQIIFYEWYKFFGLNSLILLKFIIFGLAFLIYFKENSVIPIELKAFALIPLYFLIGERLYIRPEMFAYLLGMYLLYFLRKQNMRVETVSATNKGERHLAPAAVKNKSGHNNIGQHIFFIALISIIWVNLHPSFIIGAILIFLFFLDSLLKKDKKTGLMFLKFFLVYIFAALLNPNGIKIYLRIFWELVNPYYSAAIAEWTSPLNLTGLQINSTISAFFIYLFVWMALFLFSKKKALISLSIFMAFGVLALKHRRFIAFFGFLTISDFVVYLNEFVQYLMKNLKLKALIRMFGSIFIVSAVYLSVLILTNKLYIYDRRDLRAGIGINYLTQPVNAVNFLKKVKFHRVFSSFDISSYLLYALYPKYKMFINGTFFNAKTMILYKSIMNSPNIYFSKAEKIFGIDVAILDYPNLESEKLIKYLYHSKEWGIQYFDGLTVIFKKNYRGKMQENYIKSPKNIYSEDYINKGLLFSLLGNYPRAIEYYKIALQYRPGAYEVYNNLGNIYKISGQKYKALKMYGKALKLRHNFPGARKNYESLVGNEKL